MGNFSFLQAEWAGVLEAASKAEQQSYLDARTACFYARRALELAVSWLYTHDGMLKLPYQAVADGHLVPPVAISVPLKFQREGIKYAELSDEEKDAWDELEWNEDGTTPDEVRADEVKVALQRRHCGQGARGADYPGPARCGW